MHKISPSDFKKVLAETTAERVLASISLPTPTAENLKETTILEVWVSKLSYPIMLDFFSQFSEGSEAEKEAAADDCLLKHFFESEAEKEPWLDKKDVEQMPYTYKALLTTAFIEAQNPTKKLLELRTSSGVS